MDSILPKSPVATPSSPLARILSNPGSPLTMCRSLGGAGCTSSLPVDGSSPLALSWPMSQWRRTGSAASLDEAMKWTHWQQSPRKHLEKPPGSTDQLAHSLRRRGGAKPPLFTTTTPLRGVETTGRPPAAPAASGSRPQPEVEPAVDPELDKCPTPKGPFHVPQPPNAPLMPRRSFLSGSALLRPVRPRRAPPPARRSRGDVPPLEQNPFQVRAPSPQPPPAGAA